MQHKTKRDWLLYRSVIWTSKAEYTTTFPTKNGKLFMRFACSFTQQWCFGDWKRVILKTGFKVKVFKTAPWSFLFLRSVYAYCCNLCDIVARFSDFSDPHSDFFLYFMCIWFHQTTAIIKSRFLLRLTSWESWICILNVSCFSHYFIFIPLSGNRNSKIYKWKQFYWEFGCIKLHSGDNGRHGICQINETFLVLVVSWHHYLALVHKASGGSLPSFICFISVN